MNDDKKSNEVAQCTGDWEGVADWFAKPGSALSEEAKAICGICPFKRRCADTALDDGIPFGVFGGLDETERDEYWGRDKHGRTLRPLAFTESVHAALKTVFVATEATHHKTVAFPKLESASA